MPNTGLELMTLRSRVSHSISQVLPYSVLNGEQRYLKACLPKTDDLPSCYKAQEETCDYFKSELKNYEVSPYFILKTKPRNRYLKNSITIKMFKRHLK